MHYILNLSDPIPIIETIAKGTNKLPFVEPPFPIIDQGIYFNNSAVAGALLPTSTPPPDDTPWDEILQSFTVAVTGLPGYLVRPRWQPIPPPMPEPNTNWCAIGVVSKRSDPNPALTLVNSPSGGTQLMLSRHEQIVARWSFYGPQGEQMASIFRDALYIPNNYDILKGYNAGVTGTATLTKVPEPRNRQWINRYDLVCTLGRQVLRDYNVFSELSVQFYGVAEDPGIVFQGNVPTLPLPNTFALGVDLFVFSNVDGIAVNGYLFWSENVFGVDNYVFDLVTN